MTIPESLSFRHCLACKLPECDESSPECPIQQVKRQQSAEYARRRKEKQAAARAEKLKAA